MKIQFRSFYNIEVTFGHFSSLLMIKELREVCTNCKHMMFKVGNSDSKKLEDREIYCSSYPGSRISIQSSKTCRFFKLQLKYKRL